jgi:hypothetical protein
LIDKRATDLEWEATKTLQMLLDLIKRMYCYCISTKGVSHLSSIKYSAILHYIEVPIEIIKENIIYLHKKACLQNLLK